MSLTPEEERAMEGMMADFDAAYEEKDFIKLDDCIAEAIRLEYNDSAADFIKRKNFLVSNGEPKEQE